MLLTNFFLIEKKYFSEWDLQRLIHCMLFSVKNSAICPKFLSVLCKGEGLWEGYMSWGEDLGVDKTLRICPSAGMKEMVREYHSREEKREGKKRRQNANKLGNVLFSVLFALTGNRFSNKSISCCCSVAQSSLTLSSPMDCSTTGFPVLHHPLELAQTHIHQVSDATQPSNPLSSPSPPTLSLSHCQGLFQWVSSSRHLMLQNIGASASVLLTNLQGWFPLGLTGLVSWQSMGLSSTFSSTTVQRHQLFSTWLSL